MQRRAAPSIISLMELHSEGVDFSSADGRT